MMFGGGNQHIARGAASINDQAYFRLPQHHDDEDDLPYRRATTFSDFDGQILGSMAASRLGGGAHYHSRLDSASNVRDEEYEDTHINIVAQEEEDEMFDREDDGDDSEHERHMRHFQHLSQSNRNFVESLVDDILARNHQIN